ncbi:uncharacterized protein LOC131152848 [Malania oleifera]|uniref:uncharacterized protein LOC131152848 n=1 Tax=Malania oleifera TaxID=397392 RepID=UPI0025AE1C83|nr:uncharacterized protein LOC131152848 [Malania oleifera]
MAQLLSLNPLPAKTIHGFSSPPIRFCTASRRQNGSHNRASLHRQPQCNGRFSCLFSDNRKQEQARKALESALGGKKSDFEKWNKEIKRREELGGGGDAGGGGWFGWGRWFDGSDGDRFWQEAQQGGLTVLGIILMYLIVAKGEVMLAIIFNPLLFALRGTRNGFTFITSKVLKITSQTSHSDFDNTSRDEVYKHVSAKESVVRKWGSE